MSSTHSGDGSSTAAMGTETIDIAPSLPGKSKLRRSNSLNICPPKAFLPEPISAPTTPTTRSSVQPNSRHLSLRVSSSRPSSQLSRSVSLQSAVSSQRTGQSDVDSPILSAFRNLSTHGVDDSDPESMRSQGNSISPGLMIARKLEDVVVPGPPMKDVWLKEERRKQRKETIRSSFMWPSKKIFSRTDNKVSEGQPSVSISRPFNVSHVLHLEVQDFFSHSPSQMATIDNNKNALDPKRYKQRKLPPTPLTPPLTPERKKTDSSIRRTVAAITMPTAPSSPTDSALRSPSLILPASWRRRSRDSGLSQSCSSGQLSSRTSPQSCDNKGRGDGQILPPGSPSSPPTPPQRSHSRQWRPPPEKTAPPRPNRPDSTWYDDEDKDVLEYIMDRYYRQSMSMIYSDVKVQQPKILSNGDRLSLNSRRPSEVAIYDVEDEGLPEVHDIKDLPLQPILPLRLSTSRLSFESDYSSASSVSSQPVNSASASPVPIKVQRTMMNGNLPQRSQNSSSISSRFQSLKHSSKGAMRHERRISEEPDDLSAYESQSAKSAVNRRVSVERVSYESPVLGTATFF
ncbi:hypothetical protein V1525DRAFT_392895 [Lipomyces kononenkoae]|uniref:Uncharacterized protein n=1 Tax=Lipomyces kononenkoae TaxID=34357 RepID=A0ACC3TBN0_LIPKO